MTPARRRRDRPPRSVTGEQRRALGTIACLTLLHGRAPTLIEIAEALGVSKVAAFYRLHWLEKKGLCEREPPSEPRDEGGRWRKRAPCAVTELGLRATLGLPPSG